MRFADCRAVDTVGKRGGSDDAGFVQVIRGRGDRQAILAETKGMASFFARLRPDVLGTYIAWEGEDRFTQLVYFTSEEEARAGEQRREILMPAVESHRFIQSLRSLVRHRGMMEGRGGPSRAHHHQPKARLVGERHRT